MDVVISVTVGPVTVIVYCLAVSAGEMLTRIFPIPSSVTVGGIGGVFGATTQSSGIGGGGGVGGGGVGVASVRFFKNIIRNMIATNMMKNTIPATNHVPAAGILL